jgi:hypothetical protein
MVFHRITRLSGEDEAKIRAHHDGEDRESKLRDQSMGGKRFGENKEGPYSVHQVL